MRRDAARLRAALEGALVVALAGAGVGAAACKASAERAESADAESTSDAGMCAPRVLLDAAWLTPDGGDAGCTDHVLLPCGVPQGATVTACTPSGFVCLDVCPGELFLACDFEAPTCVDGGVVDGAPVIVACEKCVGSLGRRPRGLARRGGVGSGSVVGDHFAEAARLEAASVIAFGDLAVRLAELGAPRALVARCTRAARDEVRHARVTARIARRHGGRVAPVRVAAREPASLEDVVTENVVEGCVRETYGALFAMHQAARASDAEIARAHARIADDETEHAALAWAIHDWGMAQLGETARRRVRRAQDAALATLGSEAQRTWPRELMRVAGVPGPEVERRLVRAFAQALAAHTAHTAQTHCR